MPPIHVDFVDAPSPTGGPKGLKGIAEPPCVPTPGAIANAIARATGTRIRRVADDARAGLGRAWRHRTARAEVGGRFIGPDGPGRGARPRSGRMGIDRWPAGRISSSGPGRASGPCPRTSSRSTGSRSCAASATPTRAFGSGRRPATRSSPPSRHPRTLDCLADASAIVGSPATRHVGTLGGNLANASPAAETSGALLCFDAQVEVRSATGQPSDRARPTCSVAPAGPTIRPDELIVAVELPELAGRRQLLRATRVPTPDGDRGGRRDGRGAPRRRRRP